MEACGVGEVDAMEDPFLSLDCPNCRQGLLMAALAKAGFIVSRKCPYCSTRVRLARPPLIMLQFGILILGTSIYCVKHEVSVFGDSLHYTAAGVGLGVMLILFGLFSLRFISEDKPRAGDKETSRTAMYYPNRA